MRKYWHVVNVGIQNTLVYRVNFLFRACFALVPLLATIYLWRTIYLSNPGKTHVAGYSLGAMISYYLLTTVVEALTAVTEDDWQIAADIRDGNISQFLLKPIDYLAYRLCLYTAGRVIYMAVAAVPVALFILFQRHYFVFPAHALTWLWFAVSVGLAALLQFFISFTLALLAFWVLEVSTFIFILFAFEYAVGGHLFPLDILPPALNHVLSFTPFPYELYFPVSIYLGRVEGTALSRGLLIQIAWVIVTAVLAHVVWRRGIRRYSAAGG